MFPLPSGVQGACAVGAITIQWCFVISAAPIVGQPQGVRPEARRAFGGERIAKRGAIPPRALHVATHVITAVADRHHCQGRERRLERLSPSPC